MPRTYVVIYQERDGSVPLLDWLLAQPARAQAKVRVLIGLLEEQGHELRRPHADYLQDEIYELRTKLQHTNYRILYGFNGREIVVLLHGITKQRADVPDREIALAQARLEAFRANPEAHTYEAE